MIQTSIARRYARALFESAGSEFERVGAELSAVATSLESGSELGLLFADPTADRKARRSLLESILAKAGLQPLVANFLRLLDDRDRLGEAPGISELYSELVDEKVGRIRAKLISAEPLPAEVEERLRAALSEATRKTVEVETELDRSLLGGVVAQVGNFVYDGSLRSQLQRLHRELTGQA